MNTTSSGYPDAHDFAHDFHHVRHNAHVDIHQCRRCWLIVNIPFPRGRADYIFIGVRAMKPSRSALKRSRSILDSRMDKTQPAGPPVWVGFCPGEPGGVVTDCKAKVGSQAEESQERRNRAGQAAVRGWT